MSLMIDYVTMPPKTQEVGNLVQGDHQKAEMNQQQVAAQVEAGVRQQSETTVRKADAENEPDRYDTEGRKGRGGHRSSERKKGEKKDKSKKKSIKEDDGHFDIFI